HFVAAGHVDTARHGPAPSGLDLRHDLLELCEIISDPIAGGLPFVPVAEIGDHDVRAVLRKTQRGAAADAERASGASDNRNFSLQRLHVMPQAPSPQAPFVALRPWGLRGLGVRHLSMRRCGMPASSNSSLTTPK